MASKITRDYLVTVGVDSGYMTEEIQSFSFTMPGDIDEDIANETICDYVFGRMTVNIKPITLETAIKLEKGGE